jgi:hypothetical protein
MNRPNFVLSVFVLAFLVAAALAASSCNSGGGMGVGGVGYPARWGGGNSGPPVFAGGPSF